MFKKRVHKGKLPVQSQMKILYEMIGLICRKTLIYLLYFNTILKSFLTTTHNILQIINYIIS